MALVNVLSKELEADLRAAAQQVTKTAAAAETLLKHLDADRARFTAMIKRIAAAAGEHKET